MHETSDCMNYKGYMKRLGFHSEKPQTDSSVTLSVKKSSHEPLHYHGMKANQTEITSGKIQASIVEKSANIEKMQQIDLGNEKETDKPESVDADVGNMQKMFFENAEKGKEDSDKNTTVERAQVNEDSENVNGGFDDEADVGNMQQMFFGNVEEEKEESDDLDDDFDDGFGDLGGMASQFFG